MTTKTAPRPDVQLARAPAADEAPAGPDMRPHLIQLHRRIGALAADLAHTEEEVAGTFERIARRRPLAESRLKEQAASARQYAAYLRLLERRYRDDEPTWN